MGCTNNFPSDTSFVPDNSYTDYPPYICPPDDLTGFEKFGTAIMNEMLLTQYQDSPNLKEYIGAFVSEMDILFDELHKVKLGRYLENAEGRQLDIIGIILQQVRSIAVDKEFFGFDKTEGALPFASLGDDVGSGIFRSLGDSTFFNEFLDDTQYRDILFARGQAVSESDWSVDAVYNVCELVIGFVPKHIRLRQQSSFDTLTHDAIPVTHDGETVVVDTQDSNRWVLELDSNVPVARINMLRAVSHWFIPVGIQFSIEIV